MVHSSRRAPGTAPANNLRRCFEDIRELIIHGRLAPGSRITEVDLAERLGVSRTPVRGALNMLQREGYVMVEASGARKTRVTVTPLTKEDARELFMIVARLEGLAALWTAQCGPAVRQKVVRTLKALNGELRALAESGGRDAGRIFEIDAAFHKVLADAGFGPRLRNMHDSIKPQIERYMRLYASAIMDRLNVSVREHAAIVRAIGAGDAAAAEAAVQANWQNGALRLSHAIETLGERGAW